MVDSAASDDADLERIFGPVRHLRYESGPVALGAEYVARIAAVEALPENQAGADKTWILTLLASSLATLARATQIR